MFPTRYNELPTPNQNYDKVKQNSYTVADVEAKAAKAHKTLGFLRRNLRECTKTVRVAMYTSMVRPTLEYASSSWNPYKAV